MVLLNKKIVLVSVLLFVSLLFFSGCTSNQSPEGNVSMVESDVITIPVEEISSQAQWFEYAFQGTNIKFFAVKASDGSIKTAFDSCDICYDLGKGYRQEGSNMICNNCGNKYPIDGLGTENLDPGGCWPTYLPSTVSDGQLVIQKADLEREIARFS